MKNYIFVTEKVFDWITRGLVWSDFYAILLGYFVDIWSLPFVRDSFSTGLSFRNIDIKSLFP